MSDPTPQKAAPPPSLNPGEYMTERVEKQIDWYDTRSASNKRWFRLLRIIEIVAAAMIPFLTAITGVPYMNYVIGGLGVLITIVAGILALFQFQERWTEYRTTAESLKKEQFLFLTKANPYNAGDIFSMFVQTVETLISKENINWSQSAVKQEQGKQGQG
jgi:hypothetical protein